LILFIISIQPLFDPSSLLAESLFARALLPLIRGTPPVLGGTPPVSGGVPRVSVGREALLRV
ncbi:MAG: hypothetical protein LBU82_03005, partial [Treponema sp.]|nr:hypothetical protein [Treponema sp.]